MKEKLFMLSQTTTMIHSNQGVISPSGMEIKSPSLTIPAATWDAEDREITAEIPEPDHPPAELSLAQFVEDFGSGLMEAVRAQNPPIFTGEMKAERNAILAGLKRTLFAVQARTVQAVTTLLCDHGEKSAIINGEMGSGKVRRVGVK
jgi:hypothetical protein